MNNILSQAKKAYEKGDNIIQFLIGKGIPKETAILISYDLQSGSYIEQTKGDPEYNSAYTSAISDVINKLGTFKSICEVGIGEGTTFSGVVRKLKSVPDIRMGFDISWSRIKCAKEYCGSKGLNPALFVADLFNIPLPDNSVDLVYTSHSIEPNGGREEEAIKELMRITKKYLVLLEPCYELANKEAKARMDRHGYVKDLGSVSEILGFHVFEHRLFNVSNNPLNPTGLLILKKTGISEESEYNKPDLTCPITKSKLNPCTSLGADSFYHSDDGIFYPALMGIPCLTKGHGIIATKLQSAINRQMGEGYAEGRMQQKYGGGYA